MLGELQLDIFDKTRIIDASQITALEIRKFLRQFAKYPETPVGS
jgi:hypothetical protein